MIIENASMSLRILISAAYGIRMRAYEAFDEAEHWAQHKAKRVSLFLDDIGDEMLDDIAAENDHIFEVRKHIERFGLKKGFAELLCYCVPEHKSQELVDKIREKKEKKNARR